jgi:hypothetical protein
MTNIGVVVRKEVSDGREEPHKVPRDDNPKRELNIPDIESHKKFVENMFSILKK